MGKDVEVLSMIKDEHKECLKSIVTRVPYRSVSEKKNILSNTKIIVDALKLYGKYEKLINLMETCNFDIDSVCNLIYIQAETIDVKDYYTTEKINELYKEGKIKGYDK